MASKEALRGRDVAESERSSTSAGVDKAHSRLPSSIREILEVEEISPAPIRRSFSKRRIISSGQKVKASNIELAARPYQKQQNVITSQTTSKLSKKLSDESEGLASLKQTLKSRILSAIDLSMISESKNESKLQTPQQAGSRKQSTKNEHSSYPTQSKQTTFSKWTSSRRPPIKKDHEFSRNIQFSANQICQISVDPCLMSFHQDLTLNQSAIVNRMNFKDYISNSCKLFPSPKDQCIDNGRSLCRSGSREKTNAAAKKIIAIENLFAQKGIQLSSNFTKLSSTKKKIVASLLEPQRKEDSIVRFEASLDED